MDLTDPTSATNILREVDAHGFARAEWKRNLDHIIRAFPGHDDEDNFESMMHQNPIDEDEQILKHMRYRDRAARFDRGAATGMGGGGVRPRPDDRRSFYFDREKIKHIPTEAVLDHVNIGGFSRLNQFNPEGVSLLEEESLIDLLKTNPDINQDNFIGDMGFFNTEGFPRMMRPDAVGDDTENRLRYILVKNNHMKPG